MTTVIHPINSLGQKDSVVRFNPLNLNGCVLSLPNTYIDIAKGKWYDASLFKNTASISGCTNPINEKGIFFDGEGAVITVPNTDNLVFGEDDFSMRVWLKKLNLDNYQAVISKGMSGAGEWMLYQGNSRTIVFYSASGILIAGTSDIDDGVWHRVCMTRVGSKGVLYVDGIEEGVDSSSGCNLSSTKNITLGAAEEGAERIYGGYLADIRLLNAGLSNDDALSDYNQTKRFYQ